MQCDVCCHEYEVDDDIIEAANLQTQDTQNIFTVSRWAKKDWTSDALSDVSY